MSARHDQLLDIEKRFWTGDEAFFREYADRECLVAFPQMAGTMANADLAKTATDPHRWRDLEMELKGIVEPLPGVVIVSYEAKAVSASGETYRALVSSGYVERGEGWKLMFHAQAPLGEANSAQK